MSVIRFCVPALFALVFLAAPLPGETMKQAFPGLIGLLEPDFQQRFGEIEVHRGSLPVADGVFDLVLPKGFYALDAKDAQYVMHDIWGNLPDPDIQAMIFRSGHSPYDREWAVSVSWYRDGHISDIEGATMDFEAILTSMRDGEAAINAERKTAGQPTVTTLGWSGTPGFDKQSHSLRYAVLLQQEGYEPQLLNAHAVVLGRYGYVMMNVIGEAAQADAVDAALPTLIGMVQYSPGNLYADYVPGVDALSENGLAGLMGDGSVASVGLLVLALAFLKKGAFLLIIPAIWLKQKIFPKSTPDA